MSADDPLVSIYVDQEHGCVSIAGLTGPKRYARVWIAQPHMVEWGWVLNPSSQLVYGPDERNEASGDA